MAEEAKYKLITFVDPRKIDVPFRERFAKLTLSNKKKKDRKSEINEMNKEVAQIKRDSIKRASASCNLLELLDDEDIDADVASNKIYLPANVTSATLHINPLLISEGSDNDETQLDELQLQEAHTGATEVEIGDKDLTHNMQPLNFTEDLSPFLEDDIDRRVEMISQRVSLLAVSDHRPKSSRFSTTGSEVHEASLLVSTESQRMSCDLNIPDIRRSRTLVHKPEKNDSLYNSICLLSSSESESECASAITISDTSNSEEDFMDFDVITSNIPASGETADAFLPNTFSNDKADRMEAFLRDVSQQRKEIEGLNVTNENTITTQNKNNIELACADTEIMSTLGIDRVVRVPQNTNLNFSTMENVQQIAQCDTVSMSQSYVANSASNTFSNSLQDTLPPVKQVSDDSRRLAYDDTADNSLNTIDDKWTGSWKSVSNAVPSFKQNCSDDNFKDNMASNEDIPEESVVISETSSEPLNTSLHASKSNNDIVSSEQSPFSYDTNSPSTPKQYQMDVESISISAKINIKISISQQITDSDGEDSPFVSSDNSNGDKRVPSLPTSNESNESMHRCEEERKQREQFNGLEAEQIEKSEQMSSLKENTEGDVQFLTQAERLLNQIYGQSWKTPDVIRTLKHTSRTVNENQSPPIAQNNIIAKSKPPSSMKLKEDSVKNANKEKVDQSVLDDFSIFRRNIVRKNLNSTRLKTPRPQNKNKREVRTPFTNTNSEPRVTQQRKNPYKLPQTEVKRHPTIKEVKRKALTERWREIVDEDSDYSGDNASDDDLINETKRNSSSGEDVSTKDKDSDDSWRQKTSTSDDSDYEIARRNKSRIRKKLNGYSNTKNKIVYLDLTKHEVSVQDNPPNTPPANDDVNFNSRLQDILSTCKVTEKTKLPATPTTTGSSKRKLFNPNFGEEDIDLALGEDGVPRTPKNKASDDEEFLLDTADTPLNTGFPKAFVINRQLESIKRGDLVFKTPTPRVAKTIKNDTPRKQRTRAQKGINFNIPTLDKIYNTPNYKYGFLRSLDVRVGKALCHPDALSYRDNYRLKKEELANILYELYNEKLFNNKLDVPLIWNKKLCNTAGRCLNKKKANIRTSAIELSEKVLTSADRLRCTLIHELCHAATWIFNGEGGHGSTWKQWAQRANSTFPEIPKIGVCHQYDIEYKYTYKCSLCAAKSHAHSKSKKVENIRCAFCHGAIEIFLNKKDKDGNIMSIPVKEPTGFAKFVKDNYKQHKRPDLKHADVMKILSNQFACLKVAATTK